MPEIEVSAGFSVGQVVHHLKFDYRGVIVDIDPQFEGSDEWYEDVALSRPPRDRPWYHVLVDGSDRMTYVAERHLESIDNPGPVHHPAVEDYFVRFENGVYQPRGGLN